MKKRENLLDEMQERKLLMIEHNMAWLAFWGLLAAMVIQLLLFGPARWETMAGEWAVFMVICIYLVVKCVKNGIWDRKMKPDRRTNFLASLIGAAAVFALSVFFVHRNTGDWSTALRASAILGLITLMLCYGAMMMTAKLYQNRLTELEDAAGEEQG